jgi:putative ABC transport system permease protein
MILVALKMLVGDKLKYLTLVVGIAFASLLITQQASIFNGYARQTGAWIRDSSVGDLWVMDEQVDMSVDLKPMSDTTLNRIRGVEGVEWAVPMYYGFVSAIFPDGTRRNVRVIGLDDASLIGAPPTMIEGTLADLRKDKAVLMNADLADGPLTLKRNESGPRPMRVGDRLSFNDNEVVVQGSYRATREFFWEPVFYTTFSRARFIYKDQRKGLQYVLVKVEAGKDVGQVRQAIAALGGSIDALTNKQWEDRTMWWILQETGILINFGITIMLGLVIGLLVAGQTFYTFVVDNLRHFGALKAMGVRNFAIVRMISTQVAVVSMIGFGIGVGLAVMSGKSLGGVGLAFEMNWQIIAAGATGILVCSLLAGLLGLVRVIRLEPAIVFRG